MASDNNNLQNRTADHDDDATAEVEVITAGFQESPDAELDADTSPLDDIGAAAEDVPDDADAPGTRIEELEYEIECLRSRYAGAQQEITAREELTALLQRDLRDAHKQIRSRVRELGRLQKRLDEGQPDEDVAALRERIGELETALADAAQDRPGVPAAAPAANERLEAALRELQDLRAYVDGRQREWQETEATIEEQREALAELRAAVAGRTDECGRLSLELDAARQHGAVLTTEITQTRERNRQLDARCRSLLEELDELTGTGLPERERRIEELEGRLAENRRALERSSNNETRLEHYADELRRRIDELERLLQSRHVSRDDVDGALSQANERIEALDGELADARARVAELTDRLQARETETGRELRQLRFELDDARSTIVEQDTVAQQLTSDLIDNKSFKQALESQLAARDGEHAETTRRLERRIRKLEQALDEAKYKLDSKNEAINALLNELAARSSGGADADHVDELVDRIDEQSGDEPGTGADREKISRVLIGNIDGQTLRFPLFKDRLTVGRTSQNDIQLSAPSISRRHAVILCDDEGTRIVDWGSKNGVCVNGKRISECILAHGDRVAIATAEFVYEERARR